MKRGIDFNGYFASSRRSSSKLRAPLRSSSKLRGPLLLQRQSLKNRVKAIVSSTEETKVQVGNATGSTQVLQAGLANLGGNYAVCNPSDSSFGYTVSQGVGANQRIGNRIRTKSLKVNITLAPLPYNVTTNSVPKPLDVRVFFFKSKITPTEDLAVGQVVGSGFLFENGTTNIGTVGSLIDLTKRLSSDDWTYCTSRTYKLGYAAYGGTGTQVGQQSYTNNDYKLNVIDTIDLTKWCQSVIKFDDSGFVNVPMLYCLIMPVAADGSTFATSQLVSQWTMQSIYKFTDA